MTAQPIYTYRYETPEIIFETKTEKQERLIVDNLDLLVRKIECELESLDNDCKETIETEYFGLQIYVDVATRGWDYRSIELIAVDIMNSDSDALNTASEVLFNALSDNVHRLNEEMDRRYENK